MAKWLVTICALLLVMGCSKQSGDRGVNEMTGDKPPQVSVQIGDQLFETVLGTYCWSGGGQSVCADTGGPVELLEGKQPIPVDLGAEIRFAMDYKPLPNEVHVTQYAG